MVVLTTAGRTSDVSVKEFICFNTLSVCVCVCVCVPQEFEQFNKRLGEVSGQVRIPLPVSNVLWEHCIRLANRTLVEG